MDCSTPDFPVHHQLPELAQTHVHWVSDAIQSSHRCPLLLLLSIFPSTRVFSNESLLCIRWPKYWSFSFKITADGDCSHEIKRRLLLGRKVVTNLDSILKSRDITFPTKIHLVKAMVFPAVMYRCESWTIKKTDSWRMMLSNCCAVEDSWESLEQQGDQTSQS